MQAWAAVVAASARSRDMDRPPSLAPPAVAGSWVGGAPRIARLGALACVPLPG
jgi:hypothetical protein